MNKKKGLLVCFLVGLIIFGFITPSVKCDINDIEFGFYEKDLFNEESLGLGDLVNLENETYFTDYFYGSYSFEDDTIDEFPKYWVDLCAGSTGGDVQMSAKNHTNIFVLQDYDCFEIARARQNWGESVAFGCIDFWVMTSDHYKETHVSIYEEGVGVAILLRIKNNYFSINNGSWYDLILAGSMTWFHVSIDFNCVLDQCDIYIQGIDLGTYDFYAGADYLDYLDVYTYTTDDNYIMYFDAFGYTWHSNYSFRENFLPLKTYGDTLVVSKWDFRFEDYNDPFDDGDDLKLEEMLPTFAWWNETDNNDDLVNIRVDKHDSNDRVVEIEGSDFYHGMTWIYSLMSNESVCMFSCRFEFEKADDNGDALYIDLWNRNETKKLVRLVFYPKLESFCYWGLGVEEYVEFPEGWDLGIDEVFELEIYLNFDCDMCIIDFYRNDVYEHRMTCPLLEIWDEGIGYINISSYSDYSDSIITYIDSCGLYSLQDNGLFYNWVDTVLETSYITFDLDIDEWDFSQYFILQAEIDSGAIAIGCVDNDYDISPSNPDGDVLYECNHWTQSLGYGIEAILTDEYYEYVQFYSSSVIVYNVTVVMFVYDWILNATSFRVSGYYMSEGDNIYYPSFDFYNVAFGNGSYFYVSNGTNYLYWFFEANLTKIEYMTITFSVSPVISTANRSCYLSTLREYGAIALFRLNYGSTYTEKEIDYGTRTTQYLLNQDLNLQEISLTITDEDKDYITLGYGCIKSFSLLYLRDVSISLLTNQLIEVMIPLIFIIIPTLALSSKLGKSGILPLFFFMSLICYIANLIPVWLFVIIAICSGLFLFSERGAGIE